MTPHGIYEGPLPDDFLSHMRMHLTEYGYAPRDAEGWTEIDIGPAVVRLRTGPLRIEFLGTSEAQRHQLREMALYLLDHLCPEAGAGIVWQGFPPFEGAPPSFHLGRLAGRRRISPGFMRIDLDCADTAALTTGGMHFSLLLPPDDAAPEWPRLSPEGRTIWPGGKAQLHRAAYTFVTLDPGAGRFSFDIFLHPGSRTSDWAEQAPLGAPVGLTGPGGGDFPPGERILLAGDETALPAIRRILEHSAPDRHCTVLIEADNPEDHLLDPPPACKALRWVDRGGLWEALRETPAPEGPDRFVWVAAEQDTVRRAKAHFRATAGLAAREGYFSSYWTGKPG
ncbi:siderophore-interacting protein [Paenirhodobacter sp.]|uniref:siderophore-interacting protein n=1 Tax=Paenirhodobacter sp. TaxID=1965326 RepID=UPI003B3EB2EA